MSKIIKLYFLVIIASSLTSKADDPPAEGQQANTPPENPDVSYKTAVVQLDKNQTPTDTMVVVNVESTAGVAAPYKKYCLYAAEKTGYFTASAVKFADLELSADGNPVTVPYVYDVYTFWRDGQLLVVCLRHYYAGVSSHYKYFMREGLTWKEVDTAELGADQYGFLQTENLTKLLNDTFELNKSAEPSKPAEEEKSGLSTNTKVVVGVVLGFVVLLLLVGLVFFLRK